MFILKNNPSLRRMRLMRRDFGTTCTQKGIAVRRSLSVRSCFGAWCTNSYTSEKTTSNGEFIRTDTRATKSLVGNHYTQAQGRSMVEMLGVLAIIGVLSVGAIAGYSKAMMKYKLNKQAEQISWLLNVMYRHRLSFGRGPQAMSLTPYFIKLGEIPQEMIKDGSGYLYDRFGAKIVLQTNGCENNICNSIILRYHTSSSENFAVCQNLLTVAKEFHNDIYNTGVYKNTNDTDNYGNSYYGDKKCTNNCIRNITQEQIYNQCKYCDEGSTGCHLYFIFRIE